jgi:hypothetical protein
MPSLLEVNISYFKTECVDVSDRMGDRKREMI